MPGPRQHRHCCHPQPGMDHKHCASAQRPNYKSEKPNNSGVLVFPNQNGTAFPNTLHNNGIGLRKIISEQG